MIEFIYLVISVFSYLDIARKYTKCHTFLRHPVQAKFEKLINKNEIILEMHFSPMLINQYITINLLLFTIIYYYLLLYFRNIRRILHIRRILPRLCVFLFLYIFQIGSY